jgi:succinate dehydrogenase/fumarate reductase flavoprotein subunit
MGSDMTKKALRKRAQELQEQELRAAAAKGDEELNHDAIDARVLDILAEEAKTNPAYTKAALSDYVGRARGAVRTAKGLQHKSDEKGQLAFSLTRDILVPVGDMRSQYLGVLVENMDLARLHKAARIYHLEGRAQHKEALIADSKSLLLYDVVDTVLAGRAVQWDDDEAEAA